MCRIVLVNNYKQDKTKASDLDVNLFVESWDQNEDGSGITWLDKDKQWKVFKTFNKLEYIMKVCELLRNKTKFISHNRFSTSGENVKDAIHPVKYGNSYNRYLVIHNGIISATLHPECYARKDKSDTQMVEKFLNDGSLKLEDMERFAQQNASRFVIVDTKEKNFDKAIHIYNAYSGSYKDFGWQSWVDYYSNAWSTGKDTYSYNYDTDDDDYDIVWDDVKKDYVYKPKTKKFEAPKKKTDGKYDFNSENELYDYVKANCKDYDSALIMVRSLEDENEIAPDVDIGDVTDTLYDEFYNEDYYKQE